MADSEKMGAGDILRTCPVERRGVFEILARKAPKSRAAGPGQAQRRARGRATPV